MSDQLALAFAETLARQFERFHAENPHVYETLVQLAREWVKQTSRRKLGIKTLYERARWEIVLATKTPDYQLNNNYTAFYARLIMHENPDLAGMFNLRLSEADQWLQHYRPAS